MKENKVRGKRSKHYQKIDEEANREPFNELSVNQTALALRNFVPVVRYRRLSDIERVPRRRSRKRNHHKRRRSYSPKARSAPLGRLPNDYEEREKCNACTIM